MNWLRRIWQPIAALMLAGAAVLTMLWARRSQQRADAIGDDIRQQGRDKTASVEQLQQAMRREQQHAQRAQQLITDTEDAIDAIQQDSPVVADRVRRINQRLLGR